MELTVSEREIADARNLNTILYLPLIAGTLAIGTLILGTTGNTRVFQEDELELCSGFAGQAAQTLENVLLFEKAKEQTILLEKEISDRIFTEKLLKQKIDELERFHNLTVNREIKMIDLKKEINNLLREMGREEKYKIVGKPD